MTTEIEKQFFETFGIEPIKECFNGDCIVKEEIGYDCNICDDKCVYIERRYPQITDRILLELICLHNTYVWEVITSTVDELKNVLLNRYIEYVNLMLNEDEKQEYINEVQALFKENNQWK